MKLSISLPENIAREVRTLAKKSDRSISWWIQKAWMIARTQLNNSHEDESRRAQDAMKTLMSLKGSLKKHYPNTTSVALAKSAFTGLQKK